MTTVEDKRMFDHSEDLFNLRNANGYKNMKISRQILQLGMQLNISID